LPRLDDLDAELMASVLTTHSSGVRVLLSMPWSKDGDSVHAAHYERILDWLQVVNDYVVVDTSPSLDESTTAVLQYSDQVIVVLTPEMTALRNARVFFRTVESWGEPAGKFLLALNRYPAKGGIQLKDIEGALHRRVDIEIAGDEPLVTFSINRGIPLFMSHPRSPVAQGYARLAEAVVAGAGKKQAGAKGKALLG
jgi:pilus assembly protein CpaE